MIGGCGGDGGDGGSRFSKAKDSRVEEKKVSLVDGVFDGAFGGVGDEEVLVGEGFEEDEDDKKSGEDDLFNKGV
ncbi:hypothetical protein Tco_1113822 [Tanacetum coccineum]|uniref:Uncharacterized protein n=1 Tax=Tanacetum coccineum TaxID=301880 RepID=A0ABQ5ITK0_9ASTR